MADLLAYIDAGTGSMVVQVVIAAIIAVPFILRTQLARGANFVKGVLGRKESESTDDSGGR
jgi:hypothetical protein